MQPTVSALPLPEEPLDETAPALPEDILEQIFLRLPPSSPACLVRASLASKRWLALLTGPRFRTRYRDHHAAPPTLGFLNSSVAKNHKLTTLHFNQTEVKKTQSKTSCDWTWQTCRYQHV
jgi:hypothetical protein